MSSEVVIVGLLYVSCHVSCLTQTCQKTFFLSLYYVSWDVKMDFKLILKGGLWYTKGLHSSVKMTVGLDWG